MCLRPPTLWLLTSLCWRKHPLQRIHLCSLPQICLVLIFFVVFASHWLFYVAETKCMQVTNRVEHHELCWVSLFLFLLVVAGSGQSCVQLVECCPWSSHCASKWLVFVPGPAVSSAVACCLCLLSLPLCMSVSWFGYIQLFSLFACNLCFIFFRNWHDHFSVCNTKLFPCTVE